MLSNPFRLSPVLDTKLSDMLFVDREEELQKILRSVRSGINCLIVGDHGSGKTTLLYKVKRILENENHFFPVVVSTTFGVDSLTQLDFLYQLFSETLGQVKRKGLLADYSREVRNKPSVSVDVYNVYDNLQHIIGELKSLSYTGVFLVDDIDKYAFSRFQKVLRGLRDSLWRLMTPFVFTATRDFAMKIKQNPALSDFFVLIILNKFDFKDTKLLVKKRLEVHESNVKFSEKALRKIYEFSDGTPRQVIRLCHEAYSQASVENKNRILGSDVSDMITTAVYSGMEAVLSKRYKPLIDELKEKGKVSASSK